MFFGFLHSRKVCIPGEKAFNKGAHLTMQDILVDNLAKPQSVQVRINASKTDPFRQGVLVYVDHINQPLCPVSALLVYMVRRATGQGPCSSSRMAGLSQRYVLPLRSGRLCWQLGLARSPILGIFSLLGLPPLLLGQKKVGRAQPISFTSRLLVITWPADHLASVSRKLVAQ